MDFFATCAKGTEGALRRELIALRVTRVRGDRGGVWFGGDLEAGMKACLYSRVATRILLQLGSFDAVGADALYAATRTIDWSEWLTAKTTLAVEATVRDSELTHSHFTALKVKDAVVDSLRDKLGARPDVNASDPDVRIVLHLAKDKATLSLDLAGEPMHKRGYRIAMTDAPLKENLAAAVLALGNAAHDRPLVDPMCGSGTFVIEHALAARNVPPGHSRAFGFQRWPRYRGGLQSIWDRLREDARTRVLPAARAPITARDRSSEAVEAARKNAMAAGVGGDIQFEVGGIGDFAPGGEAGTVITNPPYGERLGPRDQRGDERPPPRRFGDAGDRELRELYDRMAERFRALADWDLIVLSGNPLFEHAMKIPAKISHKLWNGPIEVRLLTWHIRPPKK